MEAVAAGLEVCKARHQLVKKHELPVEPGAAEGLDGVYCLRHEVGKHHVERHAVFLRKAVGVSDIEPVAEVVKRLVGRAEELVLLAPRPAFIVDHLVIHSLPPICFHHILYIKFRTKSAKKQEKDRC